MDELVEQILNECYKRRKDAGIGPEDMPLGFMIAEIKKSLNNLHKQKKIKVGETINDKYITIL